MKKRIFNIYLIFLSFLLIAEWVYPFHQILKINGSYWTLFFIACCFLSCLLQLRFYITLPLHLLLLYGISFLVIKKENPFTFLAFKEFSMTISSGIHGMTNLAAQSVPPLFIYLVFLTALWLLTYITIHSVFRKQRILTILIMTLLYLIIINTFTEYNATFAIIRSCFIGFLILHVAYSSSQLKNSPFSIKQAIYQLMIPLLLLVMIFAAIKLPVYKSYFPDPIPAVKSRLGLLDSTRQIGYSEDDSKLGGPLETDNTEVFQAKSKNAHYYRVESKWQYTGKGWKTPKAEKTKTFKKLTDFPINLNTNYTKRTEKIKLQFATATHYIAYPYGTNTLKSITNNFHYQPANDKITTKKGIKSYQLEVQEPIYDTSLLKKATTTKLNKQFLAQYTQLPNKMPTRIRHLAERLTKGKTNIYEKAKAIESYLNTEGDFTYSTNNATVTGRDNDYVDQFLFETKVGYCDNFSTAMVVMLRSIGIPARWAKGFTTGTMTASNDNNTQTYQITNSDAHSWPEVYFLGTGWVPFEPTASFSNPEATNEESSISSGQSDSSSNSSDNTEENTDTSTTNKDESTKQQTKQKETKKQAADTQKKAKATTSDKHINILPILLTTAVLMLLLAITGLFYRRAIATFFLKRSILKETITFSAAYKKLLRLLTTRKTKRQPAETLQHFTNRLEAPKELAKLTSHYEALLYGAHKKDSISSEEKALFLKILK